MVYWLIRSGVWSNEKEEQLKTIDKTLDNKKVSLYRSVLNKSQQKETRKVLKHLKKNQLKLLQDKHSLDDLTIEHYAETLSRQFLILSSLTREDKKDICLNNRDVTKDIAWNWFNEIYAEVLKNRYTLEEYREIARTEPWRSYWTISDKNPFGGSVVDLTDEQKTLILYSRMYDNAYKHPDFPGDHIAEDDDLFDGWLLVIREENKKTKTTKNIDHVHPKYQNADEVYVVAHSNEEAQNIDNLNTFEGKLTKKRRAAKIAYSDGKPIKAADMPDTREKLHAQAHREMVNKIKGK